MAIWKKNDDPNALTQPVRQGWAIVDLGLLGKGGMSRVYRVRDESLNREVALKVLRPELVKEGHAHARFVDEAKITAQLDHPNIPPVYALAAEKKKTTCFTMKVLEGETLQQMMDRRRNEGVDALFDSLEVLVRVCDAVAFAHDKGILHLDLKPANVMVGQHGQIYVVDWGLARRKSELPSQADDDESAVGTPAYMAPEQARGQNYALDERTDVFLLGGMLYRILVAKPPYFAATSDDTLDLAQKAVVPPPLKLAMTGTTVPSRLSAMCMKALAPNPDERYPSVVEFRKDLEDFIHGTARLPEKTFQAGEAIVREGDVGECAYIILDGHCQANRVVAGKTEMLRLLGPGEMFGEAAVLTGSPRLATVTAMMETKVAVVDRSFLQEEMQRTSLMSLAIRTVAASFLDLNGQTAALLQEQRNVKAVQLALTELAWSGRVASNGTRWVPWAALLAQIVQTTGLSTEVIVDRVGRAPGLLVDTTLDRLILKKT